MSPSDRLGAEVTVAELRAGDVPRAEQVAVLLNGQLGDGLYTAEGLLADAADPWAAVMVAEAPGFLGAAVSRLLRPADLGYYERFGAEGRRLLGSLAGSLEALAVEPVAVVATLPAGDPGHLRIPANARVERFVPHGRLLDRAVCAVTHAGMGATQKHFRAAFLSVLCLSDETSWRLLGGLRSPARGRDCPPNA